MLYEKKTNKNCYMLMTGRVQVRKLNEEMWYSLALLDSFQFSMTETLALLEFNLYQEEVAQDWSSTLFAKLPE